MPVPTVIVPLDGSTYAEHAIPAALEVARKTDARMELLRVRPSRSIRADMESRPFTDPGPPSMERRYLDRIASRLADTVPITVKVLRGNADEAIVLRAAQVSASLIVMCTHARGGAGRMLLGSVADGVVRGAAVPVLLIKAPPTEVTLPSERNLSRVLVPIDGSAESEQIVPLLVQTLGAQNTSFTLLRVVHPEAALVAAGGGTVPGERDQDPERELEQLADWLRGKGALVETRVAVDANPAGVILAEAERRGARLIAMTTRARRGTSRLVLGSVADEVLREAPRPVLLFRPFT
jgi:nucleotide-binding universal stress UspA family protein